MGCWRNSAAARSTAAALKDPSLGSSSPRWISTTCRGLCGATVSYCKLAGLSDLDRCSYEEKLESTDLHTHLLGNWIYLLLHFIKSIRKKEGKSVVGRQTEQNLYLCYILRGVWEWKKKKPANAKDCRWVSGALCPAKTATFSCNWIIWAIVCGSPKVIMLGVEAFRMSFIKENMAGYSSELMPLSNSFFFSAA